MKAQKPRFLSYPKGNGAFFATRHTNILTIMCHKSSGSTTINSIKC